MSYYYKLKIKDLEENVIYVLDLPSLEEAKKQMVDSEKYEYTLRKKEVKEDADR